MIAFRKQNEVYGAEVDNVDKKKIKIEKMKNSFKYKNNFC